MRLPLAASLLALTLAACSQGDGESDALTPAEEAEATSEAGATPSPEPEDPAEEPAPEPTATSADASDDGYSSSYTKLDLENCRVLAQSRGEGSWIKFRCQGLQGLPLFVSEGDGRFDVDAGVENDGFATIGAFNDVGDTVEWRMEDGEPFAVIFRYRDVSMESGGRSVLAVEKIGRRGAPGCRVAQIAGNTPRANERAREIADSRAASFDCSQEPQYVGDAR